MNTVQAIEQKVAGRKSTIHQTLLLGYCLCLKSPAAMGFIKNQNKTEEDVIYIVIWISVPF